MKNTNDPKMLERAQRILETKGARPLATACLNLRAKRRLGLSIHDLPDLPCGMDYRDHWQAEWEAGPVTAENLAEALAQADDCLSEILAEDGREEMLSEMESAEDAKFGSRFA